MKASFTVFLWFRALWLGLALVATGCTCSLVRNQEPAVRIGFNAWPGYEFLYWAHERGFFEREGLRVELVSFASLSDGRRALERGQIDIVGTTLFELLLARQQADLMAQAVYVMDVSAGGDEILAQGSIVDLAGLCESSDYLAVL
jgi:NitT/TauT family transport system substrate-binding protein